MWVPADLREFRNDTQPRSGRVAPTGVGRSNRSGARQFGAGGAVAQNAPYGGMLHPAILYRESERESEKKGRGALGSSRSEKSQALTTAFK